LLIIKNNF